MKCNKKNKSVRHKRSQLERARLELGEKKAVRDRILHHKKADGSVPSKLKSLLTSTQKRIDKLQRGMPEATVADVRVLVPYPNKMPALIK